MLGRQKAEELHQRYGKLGFPVDSEEVGTREGLTIVNWPLLPPIDAVKVGRWVAIRIGLPQDRRRWSIARALGHHLLHRGGQLWLQGWERLSLRKQERAADEFAAHFLVPEDELRRLAHLPVRQLAAYFGAPQQMVELRLTMLARPDSQDSP